MLTLVASPILAASVFTTSWSDADVADTPPIAAVPDLASAQQTTGVLTNALVAAVVSVSETTPPGASQADIDAGSDAISALLRGRGKAFRLIDASGSPLDHRNQPRGPFETLGLLQLAGGAPQVQRTIGNQLRTLVPLTNDMHPNCATCHTQYAGLPPGTLVGAASLRVRM